VEKRGEGGEGVETKSRGKESAFSEQEPPLLAHAQVTSGESERSRCMDAKRTDARCCEPESFLDRTADEGYHHQTRE